MKINKYIIALLFRLLDCRDVCYNDIDQERIDKWLASSWKEKGFQDYFKKRDLQLLRMMGMGLSREKYLTCVGRRVELLRLLQKAAEKGRSKKLKK